MGTSAQDVGRAGEHQKARMSGGLGGADGRGELRDPDASGERGGDVVRGRRIVRQQPDPLLDGEPSQPGEGFGGQVGPFRAFGGQPVDVLAGLALREALGLDQPAAHRRGIGVLAQARRVVLVGNEGYAVGGR